MSGGALGDFVVATLLVLQGPDKGRTFRTLNEPAVLGRQSDQIPLSDRTISRHHAELYPDNGAWVLRDLNSANGTYVNGKPVTTVALRQGDVIQVGQTKLAFGASGVPPASDSPAALHPQDRERYPEPVSPTVPIKVPDTIIQTPYEAEQE